MNMLKSILLITFAILLYSQFAFAGDFAQFRSLGFSQDGSVYAFEQYGVQDGSGFPYAEQFFINVKTDTFVKGTPVRVMIEDENALLSQARKLASGKSADILNQLNISMDHAHLAALNPSTELSSNAYEISYHASYYEPNPNDPYEIKLELLDTIPKPPCSDFMENVRAFRLSLKTSSSGLAETIYEDKSVPNSRNCPIDYRMGGVVTYEHYQKPRVHIFLVLVKSIGFEGPNGRWIAIPKVLN